MDSNTDKNRQYNMVNQTSALSPPGRVKVPNFPCVDPFLPLYSQRTYRERLKNSFRITCPLLMFSSTSELLRARCIVAKYRKSLGLPPCLTRQELIDARILYESSFHPITGEKLFLLSRLCSQVPMHSLLLGGILTYYNYCSCPNWVPWTLSHVLYQWYMASLNYSNRSYTKFDTFSWVSSFLAGSGVAIGTHNFLCRSLDRCVQPLLYRFIPLFSVGAATLVSVPLMRYREIINGIPVYDKDERLLGYSSSSAYHAIFATTITRLMTIVPGLIIAPLIMEHLYIKGYLCQKQRRILPINIALMAASLMVTVPMACALFPQRYDLPISAYEKAIQTKARELIPRPKYGYYIKGN